jgi:hypothetical protein
MKNILILFLFFLAACQSGGIHPVPTSAHKAANKNLLFPLGIYQHKITLHPAKGKTRTFNGVVALTENEIQVVGLSPFNTTFFRIKDRLDTKTFDTKFYFPLPKKAKLKFHEFYSALKETLLLKKNSKRPTKAINPQLGIQFEFSSYDKNNIPRLIQITHPFFKASIEVTSYEL